MTSKPLKIATWNVNSIRARLPIVRSWLQEAEPDIVLLQELKTTQEGFPYAELEDLPYNIEIVGQKSYNGVGIFSKEPIDVIHKTLPGFDMEDARYIEVVTSGVRCASIYVPNGGDLDSDKFVFKLKFLDALHTYMADIVQKGESYVIGGDFNVALYDIDLFDADKSHGKVLYTPEEYERMRRILHLGYQDVWRNLNAQEQTFSWWDYRAGSFQKNKGMRIDYLLASPFMADKFTGAGIDMAPRKLEKPSDHTPVYAIYES